MLMCEFMLISVWGVNYSDLLLSTLLGEQGIKDSRHQQASYANSDCWHFIDLDFNEIIYL